MDSYTFTELSNGKIFPKGEIFMSLNGDFYSVCRATQYLFWNLVWKWGINFVERDEGVANQNSYLFWAEKKLSQREKKLLASLSLWLVYTLQQHFDYALYWQTSETYERKSKSINILAILQYHILTIDIIHDYLAWRKKSNYGLISEKISFPNHVVISVSNLDCVAESSLGKIWHICSSMLFFEK